jgi:hypothetical protein
MSTEPNACLSCCNEFSGAIELCPVCSFARVSRVRLSPGASSASQDTVKLTTLEKSLRLFEHYELVTGKDGNLVELAEVPQLSRHGLAFKPLCGRFQAIFSTTFGMIFGEVGSAKPKCASSSATDLSGRATRRRRS